MSTRLRSLTFFLALVIVLTAPYVSLADCASFSGGVGPSGAGFGGSVGFGDGAMCGGIGGMFGGFSQFGLSNPFGLPGGSIFGIIANIVNWLLALLGILGILGFIVSGIMYLISAGDDDLIKKAKAGLKYSIIGIIVGLSGFIIMQAVAGLLTGMGGQY